MRRPEYVLKLLGYLGAAIIGALLLMIFLHASGIRPRVKEDMPVADFLAVILSALGVMIAILTFFLGVLAIFGWTAFRTVTEEKFDQLFHQRFNANDPKYGAAVERLVEDARARMLADAAASGALMEDEDEEAEEPNDGNS